MKKKTEEESCGKCRGKIKRESVRWMEKFLFRKNIRKAIKWMYNATAMKQSRMISDSLL